MEHVLGGELRHFHPLADAGVPDLPEAPVLRNGLS